MKTIDLKFFLEPPSLTKHAILTIEALAPLSMVAAQPGSYFRTESVPTTEMIYGMLENALGWHFDDKLRNNLIKDLNKQAKKVNKGKTEPWYDYELPISGSGFTSFLGHHLKLEYLENKYQTYIEFDDLWSQHLHDNEDFMGGSRNYDGRLTDIITLSKTPDLSKEIDPRTKKYPNLISIGNDSKKEKFERYSFEDAIRQKSGLIHTSSIRQSFPLHYVSPKLRGYVIPKEPYKFNVKTTPTLFKMVVKALDEPFAPLYIGTNDGWVEATLV